MNHTCEVLDVNRAAYYQWLNAAQGTRKTLDRQLQPLVHGVYLQHRRRYGARRIAVELASMGYQCNRSKARKIMTQMGLRAIQPKSLKPRTTDSRHRLGYSSNLLANGIDLTKCNQVWVGDITYIALQAKFIYMAILMDLYSRKIVGCSIQTSMNEAIVIATLKQAIINRQPSPDLIHHSDRGGQYASKQYRAILQRARMRQSMSRAGDCYDNAFMESCFGTIKTELDTNSYQSLEDARQQIQEYVNYYNANRRHSSLQYQSPNRFEAALKN